MTASSPPGATLRATTLVIAALAVAVPSLVVRYAPPIPHARNRLARLPRTVVPQTVVPQVEPVEFVDLPPEEARDYNASVPFSTAPNPAARPFRLGDGVEDMARATDCLATAVLYEAGNDPEGQRAVAQVVVNRARHPAFPKTICGVVFEGQERSTGCQFSFTCDGALRRWSPSPAMWDAARRIATAALTGIVYRPVGYATHYHTDWVVPYWQSSLDKIAAVHSHLFFRWAGWWGTPPAFNRQVATTEPVIAQLATLSDAHRLGGALAEAEAAIAEANAALGFADEIAEGDPASAVILPPQIAVAIRAWAPVAGDPNSFLVTMPAGYPALAAATCGDRTRCKFGGWTAGTTPPSRLPMQPAEIATMTFSYLRDRQFGYERTLWNCQQVPRPDPRQCMKTQVITNPAAPAAPADLPGVRRTPAATPAPVTPPGTSPAATP